jgi:hypothetical protein
MSTKNGFSDEPTRSKNVVRFCGSEEEVSDALNCYYESFHADQPEPRLVSGLPEVTGDEECFEKFNQLPEPELWKFLGFNQEDGKVPFFNDYLSLAGHNPIDHPSAFKDLDSENLPEDFIPCRLRWAQLVGIAAAITTFTQNDAAAVRKSILLADDVGLGKTGTVMGIIAVFMHARMLQEKGAPLPPIFGECKAFSLISH